MFINLANVRWPQVVFFFVFVYFRKMLCLLQWSYGPLMCVWKWPIQSLVQSPRSLQWHTGKDFTYSTIIFHNLVFTKIPYTSVYAKFPHMFVFCFRGWWTQLLCVQSRGGQSCCNRILPNNTSFNTWVFSEYLQDAFVKIVRGEGVKALWSGLPPTL